MSSSRSKKPYAHAQSELEELANAIATANSFAIASRNPNFGKGSWVTWTRHVGWRVDELRLLFRWSGRSGYRGVYADVSTKVVIGSDLALVDAYPTAWIARRSSDDLTLREKDLVAPVGVVTTLRSDLVSSIQWLDRVYCSPAAALERVSSADRNGVGVGSTKHSAVVAQLRNLAVSD